MPAFYDLSAASQRTKKLYVWLSPAFHSSGSVNTHSGVAIHHGLVTWYATIFLLNLSCKACWDTIQKLVSNIVTTKKLPNPWGQTTMNNSVDILTLGITSPWWPCKSGEKMFYDFTIYLQLHNAQWTSKSGCCQHLASAGRVNRPGKLNQAEREKETSRQWTRVGWLLMLSSSAVLRAVPRALENSFQPIVYRLTEHQEVHVAINNDG